MELDRPKFITFEPGKFPSREEFDTVELKFDGWWAQFLLEGHTWEIWSRTGELKKHGTLKKPWERTLVHGEYLFGTEWAKDRPNLYDKLALHSVVEYREMSMSQLTYHETGLILEEVVEQLGHEDVRRGVMAVAQWPIEEADKIWAQFVLNRDEDYEGLIFKNSQANWGSPIGRMKKNTSMDYVCMGFEESDSETYAGVGVASIIGGLYVDGRLVQKCKVSGMLNEQRFEFFDHPERYVGRVFEAEGKKITKKGALRHPNYLRFRDDKPAEDCKWDK